MKIPVAGSHFPLLPVGPAGILFDSRPEFRWRERPPSREALHGPRDVYPDQNAADVEDNGAELSGRHGLVGLVASDGRTRSVRRSFSGTEYADDGRQNRNEHDDCNDIVNVLADIGDQVAERIAPKDRSANPEDAA